MKIILRIILPIILIVTSCDEDDAQNNQDQNSIVGTWQLVEQYADDGSGNGSWEPVANGKVVTINADGTWSCNNPICNSAATVTSSGTYTTTQFISTDCTVSYNFNGDTLDLLYICIEPCTGRFQRL